MNDQIRISRFDQVHLLSTKNINYLSAPPGTKVDPEGIWTVSAIVGEELLLVKKNAVIKAPVANVLKVADYDITRLTKVLGRLSRGKEKQTDQKDQRRNTK